jgi:(p)ppGpp synthase/HD superfamily hydrolase
LVSAAVGEPDANLVIAALLHDTIEDAGVRRDQLVMRFGSDDHTFELVADILGNSPEVIRKHYGKWAKGRQDNIDRAMFAHFQTGAIAAPVTPQSHENFGAVN